MSRCQKQIIFGYSVLSDFLVLGVFNLPPGPQSLSQRAQSFSIQNNFARFRFNRLRDRIWKS